MISHLLFDLDNTLYSAKYNLEKNVSQRIDNFLMDVLAMSREEVEKIRAKIIREYGYSTTIEWLMAEKGFTDIESYYAVINPEDEADSLPPDPELGEFLASLPLPKAVLTNSSMEHADRVLEKLGIRNHFDHVFDIRFNNFKGKPHKEAFFRVLDAMNAEPASTLFVDDYPEFIEGFLKLGGKAVLMDEFDRYSDLPYNRIKNIKQIKDYL